MWGGCHPKSLSARAELHPREKSWVWSLGDMQGTCKGWAQAVREAPRAHAADIYSAITASTQAVQSTTGGKNGLSREQESQKRGGRNGREAW